MLAVSTDITCGCIDKALQNCVWFEHRLLFFGAAVLLHIGLPDGLSGCALLHNLHTGGEQTL